jgi:hypothetical protein
MFTLIPPAFDEVSITVARVAETVQKFGDAHITIDAISAIGSGPFLLGPTEHDEGAISPVGSETTPRLYLSPAFGIGGVSRNGDVPPAAGVSGRLQLGQRLLPNLHLVEEMNWLGGGYVSPYSIGASEQHLSIGAGVRWTPFEPKPQRWWRGFSGYFLPGGYIEHAFYLTATIGADLRDRVTQPSVTESTEATAWSPMASLAVELLGIQGHDWSLGPEFREQLAYYDGHLQPGWMALIAIHLNEL